MRRRELLLVPVGLALSGMVQAVRSPAAGSAERKALMDLLRSKVEPDIGFPVVFVVETLNISGDWAFAVVEPQRPDGRAIEIRETKLTRARPIDVIDGLRTEAVFRREGGAWKLKEYAIGATDVWYEGYCRTAPKGLIPVCPR
jgi:hypothetical protein